MENFILQYFLSQVGEFRKAWSSPGFWTFESSTKRDAAVKALSFVYLNVKTENKDDEETLKSIFDATIAEFNYRASMMLSQEIKRMLGKAAA